MQEIMGKTLKELGYTESNVSYETSGKNQQKILMVDENSVNKQNDIRKKNGFKKLNFKDERILEKNIIWVFGKNEEEIIGKTQSVSENVLRINSFHISDHLATQVYAIKNRVVRRIDHLKNDPDYFFSEKFKDTWKFYLRKLILNRIFAQVQDVTKKIIIQECYPINISDVIGECLPNSTILDKNNS
jgi:hypothetical protein